MSIIPLRTILVAAAVAACPLAAQAQEVTLRPRVEAQGAALTLGDLFAEAGPMAGRAVAPAPGAGRTATFSARFVRAAASAAGLQWTPPAGLQTIVAHGAGAADAPAGFERTAAPSGDVAVRRGEILTLVYVAPGMQLTTRARASADAAVGDTIRVVNLQSNRTVEATVTGIAAASANTH
ncbi:MAG: flagella basal body P-ring formation protein FlgA [Hyphomonadaceae bacterium]|nr:flagella basal body P-ring formation protein FlgA [Hyphomonadaceae bacterium]